MDKDRIKGKVKDVAGRIQRQTGEWTGNEESQVEGAKKQVEGKIQNALGKAKDAAKKARKKSGKPHDEPMKRSQDDAA